MVYYVQPYNKQGVHSEKEGVDLFIPKISNYLKQSTVLLGLVGVVDW